MIKVTAVDYMRYEREGFKIVRPNGSGNYLFLLSEADEFV